MAERSVSLKVYCEGGLDTRQDPFLTTPGKAIQLQNFEPGLTGGYRRIDGFDKYSTTIVPGQGKIKCISALSSTVIVAREDAVGGNVDWFKGTGTGWGTKINTDTRAIGSGPIRHTHYNWTGTERVIFVDDQNNAARWDGTTWTVLSAAGAPANPAYVAEFRNHIFYAGYSANTGAITFCVPNSENDFTTASGAGELVVGDTVTGLVVFRDQLVIFCEHSIKRLIGTSKSSFTVTPITYKLGCEVPDSIQEIGSDIIYLANDGIRNLAALEQVGELEIGSISQAVNSLITTYTTGNVSSGVIRSKSQYRIFFPESSGTETNSKGILGTYRQNSQGQTTWEWGEIKGIRPSVTDAHATIVPMMHGGFDGYIYKQEFGDTFAGTAIEAIYQTPDYDFGDEGEGRRKFVHRVTPYLVREGLSSLTLFVKYDHDSVITLQPTGDTLAGTTNSTIVYGVATYGTSTYGARAEVTIRQPVIGSGFFVSLQFQSSATTDISYTIHGFLIDAQIAGKR